jgi:serine/threonine protein kinase
MEPRTEIARAPQAGTAPGSALPAPPEKVDLGQILVRDGLLQPAQLEECLQLQRDLSTRPNTPPPRLGEILVQKGYVTQEAVERALGEQDKRVLFCPKCEVLVTVDDRPDAIEYRCGRCEASLQPPPPDSTHRKCIESSVIINSTLPVPPEVQAALRDESRRFGKYVILEALGRGGIAEVSRAWDIYLHQYVALKRIKPNPSESAAGRHSRVASLLNEAHSAIRLRHPNIVSVYDIGRVDNVYYISMECLEGRTMWDEIREQRDLGGTLYDTDPERWLGVLYQVSHAVHYAHTRPIPTFHCDLKPGNVFVAKDGRPFVLDFGLARQLGHFQDDMGMISGTPSYMSPEQAAGRNDAVDARTDVYGLGAVLYEALAGQPPFVGDMGKVILRTIKDRPRPPHEVAAEIAAARNAATGARPARRPRTIPPDLEALCLRCLEKDKDKRPQTALAIAQEIAEIIQKRRESGRESSVLIPTVRDFETGGDSPAAPPAAGRGAEASRADAFPAAKAARRAKRIAWGVAAAVALGGVWMAYSWAPSRDSEDERARGALQKLSEFRPEAAGEIPPSLPELAHRKEAIAGFKSRLVEAIGRGRPTLETLTVGGRRLTDVRLWRAKPENVVFTVQGEPDEAAWAALGPAGVAELARACGLLDRARDRYGLALYCLSAGARDEAKALLRSLEGTDLGADARRYLAEAGKEKK